MTHYYVTLNRMPLNTEPLSEEEAQSLYDSYEESLETYNSVKIKLFKAVQTEEDGNIITISNEIAQKYTKQN